MNASQEQTVFESDCHATLQFWTPRMTCYNGDTTASLRVLDTLTDVGLSVCVRVYVCVSVSEASSLTLLQSTPGFYMTNCQNVGLTNLWGVSLPSSTTQSTQYSLISITLRPKCFEHTKSNPKTEPMFVQCNLWHFIKAGGKSKYR